MRPRAPLLLPVSDAFELKPQQTIDRVRRHPGFVAFCRLVGMRIRDGRSLDAFRMLEEIGAPGDIAHKIVEGWPVREEQRRTPAERMTLEEEAAVRLSLFIPEVETADWPMLTTRAVRVAHEQRTRESREGAQVPSSSAPKSGA